MEQKNRADDRKKAALARKTGTGDWNDIPEDMLKPPRERKRDKSRAKSPVKSPNEDEETLFAPPTDSVSSGPSTNVSTAATTPEPEPFVSFHRSPPLRSVRPVYHKTSAFRQPDRQVNGSSIYFLPPPCYAEGKEEVTAMNAKSFGVFLAQTRRERGLTCTS